MFLISASYSCELLVFSGLNFSSLEALCSDVKSFGLEAKILALASKLRPQPRGFVFDLASISSYCVIGHFSCKNCVKFGNFVNFSGSNLKSYVFNHYLVLFIIIFGLGLNLQKLASASVS